MVSSSSEFTIGTIVVLRPMRWTSMSTTGARTGVEALSFLVGAEGKGRGLVALFAMAAV